MNSIKSFNEYLVAKMGKVYAVDVVFDVKNYIASDKVYSYLALQPFKVGERVFVPAGTKNLVKIVTVARCTEVKNSSGDNLAGRKWVYKSAEPEQRSASNMAEHMKMLHKNYLAEVEEAKRNNKAKLKEARQKTAMQEAANRAMDYLKSKGIDVQGVAIKVAVDRPVKITFPTVAGEVDVKGDSFNSSHVANTLEALDRLATLRRK